MNEMVKEKLSGREDHDPLYSQIRHNVISLEADANAHVAQIRFGVQALVLAAAHLHDILSRLPTTAYLISTGRNPE